MSANARQKVSKAERKAAARDELIYHLTEDLLVLLESKGIKKSDLARALGKSRSFVSQLLSGQRNMTLGTLSDICLELDVTPVVNVLPSGDKVLKYENECEWVTIDQSELKDISNVIEFSEYANEKEYVQFDTVIGQ